MLKSETYASSALYSVRNTLFERVNNLIDRPAVAALIFFMWIAAGAWIRPLSLPDEGRYVGVAWEMVRSGDWLTPTLNGLPYFHKPPLFYWLTAIAIKCFGTTDLAMRVPSLLAATLVAYSGARLLSRWCDTPMARWYLLILATLPYTYLGSQFANHDMLVAAFIASSVMFSADALFSSDRKQPWRCSMTVAWTCLALGLLSKGLIGVVLPAGIMIIWIALLRRWSWLYILLWWPAILLFTLIALPWFVLMQLKFTNFFEHFFIHQHFKRFTEASFNNINPWWFYPVVIGILCLPWSLLLVGQFKLPAQLGTQFALRRLERVWVGVVVGFFSIPASKLVGYALPAIPALAMIIANVVVTRLLPLRWFQLMPRVIASVCLLSLVPLVWTFGHNNLASSERLAWMFKHMASEKDQVISLNLYRFDFPVYAQLDIPIKVVYDWKDPSIKKTDSWPRELVDAAEFDPEAGERLLINPSDLASLLCAKKISWIIAPLNSNEPLLSSARLIQSTYFFKLMRFDRDRSNLLCRGRL